MALLCADVDVTTIKQASRPLEQQWFHDDRSHYLLHQHNSRSPYSIALPLKSCLPNTLSFRTSGFVRSFLYAAVG